MDNEKIMEKSLNMNELDQVAGGNIDQCMNDLELFEKEVGLKLYTDKVKYWTRYWPKADSDSIARLKEAFNKFGVEVDIQLGNGKIGEKIFNEYYINNELVSRAEVWEHIKKQVK